MKRRAVAAWPLIVLLAGCGGTLNDQLGYSAWITPGKYQFHDCLQAQQVDRGLAIRQKELEELMTRAAQGPGGGAVNTFVYRSEYQQVLGERQELAALYKEKRCAIEGGRTSDRQVF